MNEIYVLMNDDTRLGVIIKYGDKFGFKLNANIKDAAALPYGLYPAEHRNINYVPTNDNIVEFLKERAEYKVTEEPDRPTLFTGRYQKHDWLGNPIIADPDWWETVKKNHGKSMNDNYYIKEV